MRTKSVKQLEKVEEALLMTSPTGSSSGSDGTTELQGAMEVVGDPTADSDERQPVYDDAMDQSRQP
jgi:hypothetical protein